MSEKYGIVTNTTNGDKTNEKVMKVEMTAINERQ